MQRIFSTFPGAWPGTGLLLLRFLAGAPLIIDAIHGGAPVAQASTVAGRFGAIGVGACLLAGVWTPLAATLQMVLALWTALSQPGSDRMSLLLGGVGASVMLLGPGAWSVDARRFGRKRIDIPARQAIHHRVSGERRVDSYIDDVDAVVRCDSISRDD